MRCVDDGPHVGDCSQWTIAVADNGPGIDTKYHAKIFQTPASGNTGEHTGISLALVKKIIDVHGGTVRVASQPGKGSTFVITFPKITSH